MDVDLQNNFDDIYEDIKNDCKIEVGEIIPKNLNEETLIIFDWDDTLFASTYLTSKAGSCENVVNYITNCSLHQDKEEIRNVMNEFKQISKLVKIILETSLLHGKVCIVTNATLNWVYLSSQIYMPDILPILNKIDIISAKDIYRTITNCQITWKYLTILDITSKFYKNGMDGLCIVSFGDSQAEREAVKNVGKILQNCRVKSVKLLDLPCIKKLEKQLELLKDNFIDIISKDGNMDLMFGTEQIVVK